MAVNLHYFMNSMLIKKNIKSLTCLMTLQYLMFETNSLVHLFWDLSVLFIFQELHNVVTSTSAHILAIWSRVEHITNHKALLFESAYEPCGASSWLLSLVSVAWIDYQSFYSFLDAMLVHRSIKFIGTHLFNWVERGTARVI